MVFGDGTDADVVAFADDDLEAAVQVFHVRGGRVRGQRGWIVEKSGDPGDSGQAHLVEQFLTQFYGDQAELDGAADESTNPVPRQILVPVMPPNAEELETWLCQLRGSRVALRVPMRGDKRALAETVKRNAQDALTQHKLKRAGDFTARSAALQSIQEALGLADAPLRIECVDISHVQGTDVVASLVVFEDGLPRKSDYRHYAIREAAGGGRSDDVASIAEVTRRRFARHVSDLQNANVLTAEGKSRKFAYPPNLFVVDGGAPQVNAAAAVLDELGVTDVAVIGLAKRLEEVWVPSEPDPVIMPRNSEGLYPAAARARRGAPIRDHLPPQQAVQADDGVGAGLGARAGGAPAKSAGHPLRLGGPTAAGQRRGDHLGARHRRRDCEGRAGSPRCTGRFVSARLGDRR